MKRLLFLAIALIVVASLHAYPRDGYAYTGIKRLLYLQKLYEQGKLNLDPGATCTMEQVRLLNGANIPGIDSIPGTHKELQGEINRLFGGLDPNYSISLLDMTPGREVRYAERRSHAGYQPGSVGKLAVLTAVFVEMDRIYPGDFESQRWVLMTRVVRSGPWGIPNSHTVPFYNPQTDHFFKRHVQPGDAFSVYEWIDHMVSVSSNAAASIVWREAMLMRAFGEDYECLSESEAEAFFAETARDSLSDLSIAVVNEPLRSLGIDEDEWKLGTMFTRGASSRVPPQGGSIGTARGLMKWLVALEHGRIINPRSCLEMKRLLYLTDRRIRYASAAVLDSAQVYFKSGSLYKCRKEEGFSCGKYRGNVYNYMNSVAIVEHPDGTYYMVVLMSNVLRKNSAGDHYGLATNIDRIIRRSS